jgi:hypothetical protein
MKELSFTMMEVAKGGSALEETKGGNCYVAYAGLGFSTIGLFAAPFSGGITLGLVAFGGFITSAYGAETC